VELGHHPVGLFQVFLRSATSNAYPRKQNSDKGEGDRLPSSASILNENRLNLLIESIVLLEDGAQLVVR